MRVRWTRRALWALDEIADYIARDRPMAAQRVVERIREAVSRLPDHPDRGRPGRVLGTRELVIPNTPFIVPYRVTEETLDILAVLHAARMWPERF